MNRMSVKQTAELMNVSEQFVRVGLQQNRFPFGYAVKTSNRRWTYYINAKMFEKATGIKVK